MEYPTVFNSLSSQLISMELTRSKLNGHFMFWSGWLLRFLLHHEVGGGCFMLLQEEDAAAVNNVSQQWHLEVPEFFLKKVP